MTPIPESENLTVLAEGIESLLVELLHSRRSPSAWELVHEVETNVGYKARLVVKDVLANSCEKSALPGDFRTYLQSLLVVPEDAESSELEKALSGAAPPRHEVQSGIDSLIRQSRTYRESAAFQEMISFMARFREYAPYNNMLVRLQNPTCSFYATEKDWKKRFDRKLKEDDGRC